MAAHGVAEPCDSLVFDLVIRVCNAPPSLSLSLFFPPHVWTAGYAEAQFRQYQRLTKQIRPDLESYEKQREE